MKIKTNANIKYQGQRYTLGDEVEVNKKNLEKLEAAGIVAEVLEDDDHTDLEKLKVDDLKELAKENGIENYSSMKKDELIAALEEK